MLKSPKMWQPREYGKQHMYDLSVFVDQVMEQKVQIGIRDVQFIKEPYHFRINGYPIYMKGANQVPMDYYPDSMKSEEEIKWLIDSATNANFNMIRIWGGGMYMTDFFYEYADKVGMMIWQDMMFSCRFYPFMDDTYGQNGAIEVREQAGRMQHHTSIV